MREAAFCCSVRRTGLFLHARRVLLLVRTLAACEEFPSGSDIQFVQNEERNWAAPAAWRWPRRAASRAGKDLRLVG